jgi:hypothetical protein
VIAGSPFGPTVAAPEAAAEAAPEAAAEGTGVEADDDEDADASPVEADAEDAELDGTAEAGADADADADGANEVAADEVAADCEDEATAASELPALGDTAADDRPSPRPPPNTIARIAAPTITTAATPSSQREFAPPLVGRDAFSEGPGVRGGRVAVIRSSGRGRGRVSSRRGGRRHREPTAG